VLKGAGLVSDHVAGTHRIYRLNPSGVAAMRDQLDTFWTRALAGYRTAAEHSTKENEMTETDNATVRRHIVVEAPVERAFDVFTSQFGEFKPPEHNLFTVAIARTVFEPRVGGHIYDVGVDGSECRWARVLAFDPHERVVFSWDIGPQWQIETEPDNTSEVEVRFIAETPGRTRVELEHRKIDRHGSGWEAVHDGIADDGGWPLYLARYATLLSKVS